MNKRLIVFMNIVLAACSFPLVGMHNGQRKYVTVKHQEILAMVRNKMNDLPNQGHKEKCRCEEISKRLLAFIQFSGSFNGFNRKDGAIVNCTNLEKKLINVNILACAPYKSKNRKKKAKKKNYGIPADWGKEVYITQRCASFLAQAPANDIYGLITALKDAQEFQS